MALHQLNVAKLVEGDLIDLEHEPYAQGGDQAAIYPYEYARVEEVEQETPECVRVDTTQGSFGFPTAHEVTVVRDKDYWTRRRQIARGETPTV